MALAEQMVDFQVGMIIYVDPVLFPYCLVDNERAVVILMRVVLRLCDIVLG